ncbi:hypothetical protein C0Q70_19445 [Pomacea canaliculata]|uniref:F-box domain-containing protein n=1 Tax=Pomacea canaliculata TaxID=400727 RepID=A0A2T7NJC5_POMCA|nr:hypothetical protein C0Q70_19445 [Pomacea canaliculata]
MTELESLPNELLIYILKFLDSTDVIKVAQTCKRLLQICQAEILWQHLCQRVLYHYGKFQGFWKLPGNAYGMLVHIKVENGQIVGHVIQPPLSWNVVDPVRLKPLFIITVRDNECVVLCRQGCSAQIKMESEKATFKCETCLGDNKFPHISEQILLAWLEEELESLRGNFDQRMLRHFLQGNVSFLHRIYNLAEQTRYWSSLQLTKVPEPRGFSISPVTPGIFKGTYGSHGLEFVQITLSEDGYTLLGNKLTGDPNVPAGETSLYIDLRQPIRLTTDEQRNIDSLKECYCPYSSSSISV